MEVVGSLIARAGIRDLVEILLITFLIYQFLLLIKGTRGWQITLGIIALALFRYLTRFLDLRTVVFLLDNFFTYFVFALIVIFQSEIRRALAELGRGRFFRSFSRSTRHKAFEEIVLAATTLSSQKIGGLIVIEKDIGLKNYVESGIKLDAYLTYDLLVTIFNPTSPLHDGAVIIQDNCVRAAACFLPLTLDPYLSKELGTRHRAAIGITEETDAVAVVISEETGKISAVFEGEMTRNLDGSRLLKILERTEEKGSRLSVEASSEKSVERERKRQEAL